MGKQKQSNDPGSDAAFFGTTRKKHTPGGGKQKKLLRELIDWFLLLTDIKNKRYTTYFINQIIRERFDKSINKKDLTHRILFDALLSDDDILKLLRIIFYKEK